MLQDVCILSRPDEFTGIMNNSCATESKMWLLPTVPETLGFAFFEHLGLSDYLERKER